MIQHQSLDKFGVRRQFVNHVHDFYHVQVDGFVWDLYDVDGINNNVNQLIGKVGMKLAAERCPGNTDQERFLYSLFLDLELIQKSERFLPCQLVSLSDNSGVDLLSYRMM
jgi:hypothetical protein